jgi:hypothetical protein
MAQPMLNISMTATTAYSVNLSTRSMIARIAQRRKTRHARRH